MMTTTTTTTTFVLYDDDDDDDDDVFVLYQVTGTGGCEGVCVVSSHWYRRL
ncbi:hypothetical protein Scep_023756 [Stephania cephalantha]|uniref:Uncharacterized protein n=1 Tax=Stephania cephalantha TaxID=152367 RepID=A0AAP0EV94_9MAGN